MQDNKNSNILRPTLIYFGTSRKNEQQRWEIQVHRSIDLRGSTSCRTKCIDRRICACPGGAIGMQEPDCGIRGTTQSVSYFIYYITLLINPRALCDVVMIFSCFRFESRAVRAGIRWLKNRDLCMRERKICAYWEGRARAPFCSWLRIVGWIRSLCFRARQSSKLIRESVSDRNCAVVYHSDFETLLSWFGEEWLREDRVLRRKVYK